MKLDEKLIFIRTPDGHDIPAIYESFNENIKANTLVVIAHGIFTDKREKGRFDRLSTRLLKSTLDVIRFDFRGHGDSSLPSEKFTISGALTDYLSILNWANSLNYNNIAVIGSSFGGGIVLLERLLPNPKHLVSVVLFNPVIDYQTTFINPILDWGREIFDHHKIEKIHKEGKAILINDFECSIDFFNELCLIQPYLGFDKISSQLLIFHGNQDDKVPLETIQKLSHEYNNITLDIVLGAGHAFKDPDKEKYVHEKSIQWIKSCLTQGENNG